ncbi:MAG: ATP-binding protein [Candidatus Latescibacteria bacterium]|nr:ATP-binding protein [Candidatus Latescibacterota bacterium]
MKNNDIKSNYLEHGYNLIRLLDARKKINDEIFEAQFNISVENKKILRTKINDKKKKIKEVNKKIEKLENNLDKLCKKAKVFNEYIPLEALSEKYCLSKDEKYIMLAVFFGDWYRHHKPTGKDLMSLLGYAPNQYVNNYRIIKNLINEKLIETNDRYPYPSYTIFDFEYRLAPDTMQEIMGNDLYLLSETSDDRESRFSEGNQNTILSIREPIVSFDQIVLEDMQKQEIEQMIFQIVTGNKLFTQWGFDQTIKYGKGMTILFYGAPGTGKTATCEAIAQRLSKKIGIANYAQLLSKWIGDSEKNLVKVFKEAKENDCVLVFDEADSLFGQRLPETYSVDRMHNYMTNVLMQEIERFDGLVILTTNRELTIDEAFSRRILFKMRFDIPKTEERAKIWRALIPANAPISDDVDFAELGKRYELTGGEIKNVIINVVRECGFSNEEKISMLNLIKYAQKEKNSSLRDKSKNKLGFIS